MSDPEQVHEPDSNWEFLREPPSVDAVVKLLRELPPVFGVQTVDFVDFVQPLPQSKKVSRRDDVGRKVAEYIEAWTLYVSVAGRIKMLNAAQEVNDWEVDFRPEPKTPTGVPGYLQFDERIVYREYVVISDGARRWGRRPGTAWVPAKGGDAAAGSNPYEKVETSARGRALGAWGFGVLPGSGVASLEEMQGSVGNRAALDAEPVTRTTRGRPSREQMIEAVLTTAETLRQLRGQPEEWVIDRLRNFVQGRLGVADAVGEDGLVDWAKLKDGQIQLLANSLTDAVGEAQAQATELGGSGAD
jgi:hypothetical protein